MATSIFLLELVHTRYTHVAFFIYKKPANMIARTILINFAIVSIFYNNLDNFCIIQYNIILFPTFPLRRKEVKMSSLRQIVSLPKSSVIGYMNLLKSIDFAFEENENEQRFILVRLPELWRLSDRVLLDDKNRYIANVLVLKNKIYWHGLVLYM
jgi:hypothetical protein